MKTADEIYAGISYEEAQQCLRVNGALTERARRDGRSLNAEERNTILSAREKATILGLSVNIQTALEQEGVEIVRRALE
jgi:hypothetical protein